MEISATQVDTQKRPATVAGPDRQMIWLFPKDGKARFTANFLLREFHCQCRERGCHYSLVHPKLVDALQMLREMVATPLVITSGFRCRNYNRVVGGAARSYHTRGMAADTHSPGGVGLEELAEAAAEISAFGAIGQYPARGMVHLDVRPRQPGSSPLTWSA